MEVSMHLTTSCETLKKQCALPVKKKSKIPFFTLNNGGFCGKMVTFALYSK